MEKGLFVALILFVAFSCIPCSAQELSFEAPRLVEEIGSGTMPEVSGDGLELFFVRPSLPSPEDPCYILRAERSSRHHLFGPAAEVTELNTATYHDTAPRLSPDELTIYISTNRFNGWAFLNDIGKASRSARGLPFSTPIEVDTLSGLYSGERMGGITEDGSQGVMSQQVSGIFQIRSFFPLDPGPGWTAPSTLYVENLQDPGIDTRNPWLSKDGKLIVFAKLIPGRHYDLFYARRPDLTSSFGSPIPLDGLNTDETDASPSLTDDLRTIFFHSTRGGTEERIYAAGWVSPTSIDSSWETYE